MNDTDYKASLNSSLQRLAAIYNETEKLEIEAARLRQFIAASINMLSDEERSEFVRRFSEVNELEKIKETGLKNAILNVLRQSWPEYVTVTQTRDKLIANGFDFSGYKTNALAAISTTLRRFKPEEVETIKVETVAAFRFARPKTEELNRKKKRT